MSEVLERVNRGAALLDEFDPGWWEVIEPEELDIASCRRCVLGQWAEANVESGEFAAHYDEGLDVLDLSFDHAPELGFAEGFSEGVTYGELSAAWREAILWREYLDDQGELP
jgi:hypothetical protein